MQISQVVQSNSATAEESAAASEELAGQAEVLKEQVQMCNLKNNNSVSFHKKPVDVNFSAEFRQGNIKKNKISKASNEFINKNKPNNKGIILSDSEFGKY